MRGEDLKGGELSFILFLLELSPKQFWGVFFFERCNGYNISSACACLLCVAFGISLFFDVKDLYASKTSPRTRT